MNNSISIFKLTLSFALKSKQFNSFQNPKDLLQKASTPSYSSNRKPTISMKYNVFIDLFKFKQLWLVHHEMTQRSMMLATHIKPPKRMFE